MSDSDQDDKIKQVLNEIDKTKESVNKGIIMAIDRGDKLEDLDEKASMLHDNAEQFKKNSRRVRRHFCIQKWKMIAFITFIIIILIAIIWLVAAPSGSDK